MAAKIRLYSQDAAQFQSRMLLQRLPALFCSVFRSFCRATSISRKHFCSLLAVPSLKLQLLATSSTLRFSSSNNSADRRLSSPFSITLIPKSHIDTLCTIRWRHSVFNFSVYWDGTLVTSLSSCRVLFHKILSKVEESDCIWYKLHYDSPHQIKPHAKLSPPGRVLLSYYCWFPSRTRIEFYSHCILIIMVTTTRVLK